MLYGRDSWCKQVSGIFKPVFQETGLMLPFWLLPQMVRLQHKLHYISWQQIIHIEHSLHEYLYASKSFDQKFLLFWDTQKNLNMKQNWRKPGLSSCISQKLLIFNGLFRCALIKAADTVSLCVYKCFRLTSASTGRASAGHLRSAAHCEL